MYVSLFTPRSTKRLLVPAFILFTATFLSLSTTVGKVSAACTALPTDKGTVTSTVTIPADATYRVWSRIQSATSTNNSFYMQIDQTSCNLVVGGSSLTANTWTWVDYQSGTSTNKINATLTAGTHTITMAGKDDGVEVDRVILTQDTTCVPTGTGDNCANPPDTTPPVVSVTAPANNATISTTTTATANATDDVAISKVEFYIDGVLKATDTASPYTYSIVPTALTVGAHTLTAKAYDTATPTPNNATSSVVNFTVPDVTPPTISGISTGSITQTSASINWTTNEASDSQVDYGTTTAYGSSTTLVATKVTTHGVAISGLTANTLYHYHVKSRDAAGNLATSADGTFTTLVTAGDTTKPTVSVTAPVTASTVSGTVTVMATAADNVGVAGVQFMLDGANLGAEDTVSPYSVSWNSTTATNGSHTLTAVARDAAGNTQTATTVTVTVSNTTYAAADINQDGHVNLQDFSLLVGSSFPRSGAGLGRADINGDGSVNLQDFSLLVGSSFPR